MTEGVEGILRDKTCPPGKPSVAQDKTSAVVAMTLKPPPHEATHWRARAMAKIAGLAVSTVQKMWKAHGLAPYLWRQFKLSNDPAFAEKLHDVVRLYVSPPAHAMVLSIDEKSQIQALDRTQPGGALKRGRRAIMTHDYKHNGTTTLFAAFDVLTGEVFGRNMQRLRHQEFIRFLNARERDIPADKLVLVILDNYAPTSSSWLSAVEGFFAILTRRRRQDGVFPSSIFKPPSTASSASTTRRPSPSSGGPTSKPSSLPGTEGSKRWSQSTNCWRGATQVPISSRLARRPLTV